MFAVCVTFEIHPGQMDEFHALVVKQAQDSLTLEDTCTHFDVCTDPERPDQVFLYEVYDSAEAFLHHLSTSHFSDFNAATAGMVAAKTVVTYAYVNA